MFGSALHLVVASTPAIGASLAVLLLLRRRAEIRSYADSHREKLEAKARGSDKARLQHPAIDLSQCIGCGACVRACPEEGVLSLIHGQAVVMHGARCVGHGLCARACPTAAIDLTLGDLSDRRDLPALTHELEAVGVPGLFLVGELGGFALVRTAVTHGIAVADTAAKRLQGEGRTDDAPADDQVDLLIVGAGPGGIACSLRAKELGLRHVVIEQEDRIGGTVASYPRRKLVMTQPMVLPLHGKLKQLSYQKEELVELWGALARDHELPIRLGVRMEGLQQLDQGHFEVATTAGRICARNVALALGRRGSPRKLGVPGEDLPKVSYSLLDAESYQGRHILVVGGGDSAIEAAVGLSEQPGNVVTLSYRKHAFFRLKARNERRINEAIKRNAIDVRFETEIEGIESDRVSLRPVNLEPGQTGMMELPNDEVFVFAGGIPPFGLLENAGVSFDPKDRPEEQARVAGGGLLPALLLVLLCAVGMLSWALFQRAYYGLAPMARAASDQHAWLRPSGPMGLAFGVLAALLFVWNLSYLLRRSLRWGAWIPGSLRAWMNSHVFTGLFALLCVLIHCGFAFRDTVGGHALIAFAVVVVTGTVGRYLYAFVPRAANGTELKLDEVRSELASLSGQWDRSGRGFGEAVRLHVDELLHQGRWRPSLFGRIWVLISGQVRLRLLIRRLKRQGRAEDIPEAELLDAVSMARRAYRLTVLVTHFEEVRAVLSSWRYFHRWLALLLILLTAIHIAMAWRYASLDFYPIWPVTEGTP